jgi:hypothetical protein
MRSCSYRLSPYRDSIIQWIEQFANANADRQVDGTWYIGNHWSNDRLYSMFLDDQKRNSGIRNPNSSIPEEHIQNENPKIPSRSYFMRIKREHFKNLKTPVKGDWNTCDLCAEFERRKKDCNSEDVKLILEKDIEYHHKEHRLARELFAKRQALANTEPWNYHMFYADQARPHKHPHMQPTNKAIRRAEKQIVCTGGIKSFSNRLNFLNVSSGNFTMGMDFMVSLLFVTVMSAKAANSSFPNARTAYFQVDGGSENINFCVISFLAWLVRIGFYDEIYMHRLCVGHTHGLIDQLFRVLRTSFKKESYPTMAHYLAHINRVFKNSAPWVTSPFYVKGIWNWSSKFDFDGKKLRNHSFPLSFKLSKEGCDVYLYYQMSPNDEPNWRGEGGIFGAAGIKVDSSPDSSSLTLPKYVISKDTFKPSVRNGVESIFKYLDDASVNR